MATGLHTAASSGNDELLLHLLANGEPVDRVNEVDSTALFYAANGGHLSSVRVLVEQGADVNKRNLHGQTPIMWAVLSKNEGLVEYLISKGANVDVRGEDGLTAYGLSLVAANPLISTIIRSSSDSESIQSKSSGREVSSSDGSVSPSSVPWSTPDDEEVQREGAQRILEARRAMSNPEGAKELTKKFSITELVRTQSSSVFDSKPSSVPDDPPTVRYTQNLSDLADVIELTASSISSLDISLVPLTSQTKECKSTYSSLLKRKIMGEFLVKRGGMRTNWKCRYFLLTGDHLHYFEPQIAPRGSDEALLEPSPNATPLGSISLHAIIGNVHKSDLGIVFCFQIPTAGGRTYHVRAASAKSVERWTTVINSNVKRIQSSSSKFVDTVFRVSTTWKAGVDRSVLRTGREFQTMDAIVMDYFSHLRSPPQFPPVLQGDNPIGSQEMLALLADVSADLTIVSPRHRH